MAVGLTIDSQSFDLEGAWKHNRSLRRLRSTVESRGGNRVIPGATGRLARPLIRDQVIVDLELMVFGRNDGAGTPYATTDGGLDENLAYLEDWMQAHIDASTPTWAAALETKSGRTFSADVQVANFQILRDNAVQVVAGYDVIIPAGAWTETTPP